MGKQHQMMQVLIYIIRGAENVVIEGQIKIP